MAENSKIEWTDHTFNPWIGCTKVSDGCKNCYAEQMMDKRYGRVEWGPQGKRIRTSAANWKKPIKWNRDAKAAGKRAKVFCASLADVFEEKPDQPEMDEWRRDLFEMIINTPRLDWLLLTKRPENVCRMIERITGFSDALMWFPGNVWIGTSVENQEQADKRIHELLKIRATVRFLSCEPLLGLVDLSKPGILSNPRPSWIAKHRDNLVVDDEGTEYLPLNESGGIPIERYIHWVIVGGESGPNARPFDLSWAYSLIKQCKDASVPVFVKQFGSNPKSVQYGYEITGKGGNWYEWPEDLRVREFPLTPMLK